MGGEDGDNFMREDFMWNGMEWNRRGTFKKITEKVYRAKN